MTGQGGFGAEAALLGSILSGKRAFKDVDARLDDFQDARHKEVWPVMCVLAAQEKRITPETVIRKLRHCAALEKAGGVEYVHALAAAGREAAQQPDRLNGRRASRLDWPTLAPEALFGLAGDIVRAIDPHTEADRVAVLAHLLIGFGNMVGPAPHFRVEFDQHPPRLYGVLVGETSKSRKGQSWSTPRRMLTQADPTWAGRITSGLSSGEGLIYAVRDLAGDDPGEDDKRLFVVEEEFAQALKVMRREGNILSVTTRQAWDNGDLHPLTKTNRITATGAHISIVGHITREELLRHLTGTEQGNGFANRFLWVLVRRSKVIPNPKGIAEDALTPFVTRLREALKFAQGVKEIERDKQAEALWEAVYPVLSEGKPGLTGAIISRGEAQVMRLALVYALLDCSAQIGGEHLKAALAFWDYAETSARIIFGDRTGNPIADRILNAFRIQGEMTETEIHGLFNRNVKAGQIQAALELLTSLGLARGERQGTEGRPATLWKLYE